MPALEHPAIAHLLPEAHVGTVIAIQAIATGVYAVRSTRGELVLRVQPNGGQAWAQQRRVLEQAAAAGVAPAIVHVDEAAHAIVSRRVPGVPLGIALADPGHRGEAIHSVIAQLRVLHALDPRGLDERDPVVLARTRFESQGPRPGFPAWAHGIERILDAIAHTLAGDARRVVSHNDLEPGNVLWDGTRAWLVDWDLAGLAHPFHDLAALAMCLQLDEDAAAGLLASQEQRAIDERERATFAALRRLAALECGLTLLGQLADLAVLPAEPTLATFYAELRAGTVHLQDERGRGELALALLRLGTATSRSGSR